MADLDQAPAPDPTTLPGSDGPAAADTGATAAVETGATVATPEVEGTPASPPEDTFFDPKELPPELLSAYKRMQSSYTKKTEAIKQDRQAVDAYRSFERDPHGTLQRIAGQMGYSLGRTGEAPAPVGDELADWTPGSWQEVLSKAKDMALAEFRSEQGEQLGPVLNEVQALRKTNIEKLLDDEVPEWREYEDPMQDLLRDHPTLVNKPVLLARLAIPEEVQQSKAMQAAMRRLQAKAESGQPSSGSTTRKEPSTRPKGPMTFAQSVEQAKKDIAAGAGVTG